MYYPRHAQFHCVSNVPRGPGTLGFPSEIAALISHAGIDLFDLPKKPTGPQTGLGAEEKTWVIS